MAVSFHTDFLIQLLASCMNMLGYAISIGSFGLTSLRDIKFTTSPKDSNSPSLAIAIATFRISFHIPSPGCPRYMTLHIHDYEHKDTKHHISAQEVSVTFWLLPVYFGRATSSWASVVLSDVRVRVFASFNTPRWVAWLRTDLIATVLSGTTIHLCHIKTGVVFNPVTGTQGGPANSAAVPSDVRGEDTIVVSGSSRDWCIVKKERMYTFENLDAELKTSWGDDDSSLVLIAKESRWETAYGSQSKAAGSIWKSIFSLEIIKALYNPTSKIDIYIPRADVVFDNFRLQDTELFAQGGDMLQRWYSNNERKISGIGWDMVLSIVNPYY